MAIERRKNKDGTIGYRVRVGNTQDNGSYYYGESKTFRKLKEAQEYEREQLTLKQRGLSKTPHKITFKEHLESWLEGKRVTTRQTTCSDYTHLTTKHIIPLLGNTEVSKLTHKQLQDFLNKKFTHGRLDDQGGLSHARIRVLRVILHDSLTKAVKQSIIHVNPAQGLELPRKARNLHHGWNAEDTSRFLNSIQDDYLYPLWILALTTGMRRGELLGLKWSNVDLERQLITIKETWVQVNSRGASGDTKTDSSERCIAIGTKTTAILKEHKQKQDEYKNSVQLVWNENDLVFANDYGDHYHPSTITHKFKRMITKLNLPMIRLHDTRRTAATLSLIGGVPLRTVSERVGHSSTRVTMEIYTYSDNAQDRLAADVLEGVIL